jgi:hypothetical protein
MRVRFNVDFELSPRVKRVLRLGIPALVLLVGGVALAGVPHTFADGDPLSAQTMNDNFSSLDMRLSKLETLMGGDGGTPVVIWKDAVGVMVPIVGPIDQRPLFYDPASDAIWRYSPNTTMQWGVQTSSTNYAPLDGINVGWVTNNCTGTSYVLDPPSPRYSFTLASTGPNTFYVAPDNVDSAQISVGSRMDISKQCQGPLIAMGIPTAMLKTVSKPAKPPGTPPYHPELL